MKPNIRRSIVWSHFKKVSEKTVGCQLCKQIISYCGNTTNMLEHLKRRHPEIPGLKSAPAPNTDTAGTFDDDNGEVNVNRPHKMKWSMVWQHFKQLTVNTVVCLHCKKIFNYYGGTTNLMHHIKRHHKDMIVPDAREADPMHGHDYAFPEVEAIEALHEILQPELELEYVEDRMLWKTSNTNMRNVLPTLLDSEQYVDVTLCTDDHTLRCHKLILSSCSGYFQRILSTITSLQHPVIFLKGVSYSTLRYLIDFMYVGEVRIEEEKLAEVLELANTLQMRGFTSGMLKEVNSGIEQESNHAKTSNISEGKKMKPKSCINEPKKNIKRKLPCFQSTRLSEPAVKTKKIMTTEPSEDVTFDDDTKGPEADDNVHTEEYYVIIDPGDESEELNNSVTFEKYHPEVKVDHIGTIGTDTETSRYSDRLNCEISECDDT